MGNHLRRIWDVLRKDRTWTVVATVCAMVAALAAGFSVWQAKLALQAEREAKRPYFKIKRAFMEKVQTDGTYRFEIVFENIGIHPARDPHVKLLVKDKKLENDLFGVAYAAAMDVPKNGTLFFRRENIRPQYLKEPIHYYVIYAVKYIDPILEKEFAQIFFMQWRGPDKSKNLEYVYIPQRDKIMKDQGLKHPIDDANIIKQIWGREGRPEKPLE